jgi:hypothetical protein
MRLIDVITSHQTVSVVTESDHAITLALHDQQIGEVIRVTITADVTVDGEREGLLDWQITPVREPDNLVHVASNGEEFYLSAS